jgi:hypothetical protein
MALTNIELYEALKKDLNEDAARMIAEVVPPAQDVVTKADLLATEQRLERRMTSMERRYYFVIGVPLWGGVAAALAKYLFG